MHYWHTQIDVGKNLSFNFLYPARNPNTNFIVVTPKKSKHGYCAFQSSTFCSSKPKCLCGSRKVPHPPHGRSVEIPRGWGISKVNIFQQKCEAELKHPERCGRGKGVHWGYGFFSRTDRWGFTVMSIIIVITMTTDRHYYTRMWDCEPVYVHVFVSNYNTCIFFLSGDQNVSQFGQGEMTCRYYLCM